MSNYRINTPQISHETIDGEAVIINLDNGNYYSLDGVGADIWNLIDKGANTDQITELTAINYGIEKNEIENSINNLISELQDEGLIINSQGNGSFNSSNAKLTSFENNENPEYKKPSLEKYTDMQDLLLLDPIHEVDEAGWPIPKENN